MIAESNLVSDLSDGRQTCFVSDDRAKHGNGQRLARPQREGHRPQAKALHGNPQCRKRHFARYQSYNIRPI